MFAHPEKNIAALLLQEGMRVADFGAGSGFLTKILSRRVGHSGHVYAIEVQKDLVKKLESELKESGLSNVSVIWGDIEKRGGSKIADHMLDAVVISNLLLHAEDHLGIIDEAKRILKKGGQLVLMDRLGFPQSPALGKIKELFTQRGFVYVESVEETIEHYGIIYRSQEE